MNVVHVARKPLIGSVAKNVLQFGTGGINVNACRIGTDKVGWGGGGRGTGTWDGDNCGLQAGEPRPVTGRWPANFAVQHTAQCYVKGTERVFEHNPETGEKEEQTREVWHCPPGCPATALAEQRGDPAFFLQLQDYGEWFRASGDVPCPTCGKEYRLHPEDGRIPLLHVLCDGSRVKL